MILHVRTRLARLSLIFLLIVAGAAFLAPYITQYSYDAQNIRERLQLPSLNHWMGTDTLGRDVFTRIVYGARMSLAVGILTAISSLIFGTALGTLAGLAGGWLDLITMSTVDLLYIFPSPLLAILLMLIFGKGLMGILLALSITTSVVQARLVRAQVLQIRSLPYIEVAHALGASKPRVILRHILPNIAASIVVLLTFQISNNIMAESFLSFIGLGLQPPLSSWGTLANEGLRAMQSFPHLIIFPGSILLLTLAAFNFLGDGLNESLKLIEYNQKG